ncbi:MAG: phage minor head protein [Proteobacteria bacterium]|nr:phage minor head protein [Pseudomonadota bacterium]
MTGIQGAFGQSFAEQADFLRRKLNLPTERWDDIKKSAHDRAFIVAGAQKADLINDLHRAVEDKIKAGLGVDDFRKDFRNIVEKHGWHGWTGEGTKAGEAWRTRVIYETNLRTSYAAGRYAQLTDPGLLKRRPYWQYVHSGAEHARKEHKAWGDARLTLPHGHPFWETNYPPNGWGCGCTVRAVPAPEKDAATAPPKGWDVPDPKTGMPPGIGKGWDYAPGAKGATPLAYLLEQKLFKLDARIGAAMWEALAPAIDMERELQWYGTLESWLKDPVIRGRSAVIGALSTETISKLTARKLPIPKTAEIALADRLVVGRKQKRHEAAQNGLTEEEWRALPRILANTKRIYHDTRSGNLIFVADGSDALTKIAVEFNPAQLKKTPHNQIDTAFRVSAEDVAASIKGGIWEAL